MTNELQTRYTDGGQRPASATWAMTSKLKGQGRRVTWSVSAVCLAQCCICVIRDRRGHTVSAKSGGHTFVINWLRRQPAKYRFWLLVFVALLVCIFICQQHYNKCE